MVIGLVRPTLGGRGVTLQVPLVRGLGGGSPPPASYASNTRVAEEGVYGARR